MRQIERSPDSVAEAWLFGTRAITSEEQPACIEGLLPGCGRDDGRTGSRRLGFRDAAGLLGGATPASGSGAGKKRSGGEAGEAQQGLAAPWIGDYGRVEFVAFGRNIFCSFISVHVSGLSCVCSGAPTHGPTRLVLVLFIMPPDRTEIRGRVRRTRRCWRSGAPNE